MALLLSNVVALLINASDLVVADAAAPMDLLGRQHWAVSCRRRVADCRCSGDSEGFPRCRHQHSQDGSASRVSCVQMSTCFNQIPFDFGMQRYIDTQLMRKD